jgi:ethanolamine ammonia-lyase small subunit
MNESQLPVQCDAGNAAPAPVRMDDIVRHIRNRTPARLMTGRAGPAYRTATQLELRRDHAAALDAVHAEIDPERDFGREFVTRWDLFEVATRAGAKAEYLMRPDLGRCLSDAARDEISRRCPAGADLQVAIGDGLSATAVAMQVPELLPLLAQTASDCGWRFGQPFLIRHCRVGVLNDIGELLRPSVVVLLIGERPGLATAESLSAYMAYQPRAGHSDANRNLISNIHSRGVSCDAAARRIMALARRMISLAASGVTVKEELPELERNHSTARIPKNSPDESSKTANAENAQDQSTR